MLVFLINSNRLCPSKTKIDILCHFNLFVLSTLVTPCLVGERNFCGVLLDCLGSFFGCPNLLLAQKFSWIRHWTLLILYALITILYEWDSFASERWEEHNNPTEKAEPAKHSKNNLYHIFNWVIFCKAPLNDKVRRYLEASDIALLKSTLKEQKDFEIVTF